VPDKGNVSEGSEALEAMVRVALALPADVGENVRLKLALCPGETVRGRLGAFKEKESLETTALLMVTDAEPEFVAIAARVLLLPVATLPKSTLALVPESVPNCCWAEEAATLKP